MRSALWSTEGFTSSAFHSQLCGQELHPFLFSRTGHCPEEGRKCQLLSSQNFGQKGTFAALLKKPRHRSQRDLSNPFLNKGREGKWLPAVPIARRQLPPAWKSCSMEEPIHQAQPSPCQPQPPQPALSVCPPGSSGAATALSQRLFSAQRKTSDSSGYFFWIIHYFLSVSGRTATCLRMETLFHH